MVTLQLKTTRPTIRGCEPKIHRMEFNEKLRKVFGGGDIEIAGFPVTLIDLNVVFPEKSLYNKNFYCFQESFKVHYNATHYAKFLDYLYDILRSHGGLQGHSVGEVVEPILPSLSCEAQTPHASSSLPSSLHATAVPSHSSASSSSTADPVQPFSADPVQPSIVDPVQPSSSSCLQFPEHTGVSVLDAAEAQEGDIPSLSQTSLPDEAGPSADPLDDSETKPVDNTEKPKRTRRGKRPKKVRRYDPFWSMRLDCDPSD